MPSDLGITTEHTVWCSVCEFWEQICIHRMSDTIIEAKRRGWRNVKGKWVCPTCLNKIKKRK